MAEKMIMKIDRRLFKNFDWITLALTAFLSFAGIITIYSATRSPVTGEMPSFYIKQIYWLAFSIICLIAIVGFDYSWIGRFSCIFYVIGLALLLLVIMIGRTGMGAQRWLNLGIFSFQPSELFKLFYVIAISRYLSGIQGRLGPGAVFMSFLVTLIPLLMIIIQPDLGTAVIVLSIFVSLIAAKGLHRKITVFLALLVLISIPFLGNILWEGMKDYQKSRVVAFLEPDSDPSGTGYHVAQSKIAIGSGKIFGKGYLRGTQGPFRFLPEKHTDFVFAAFSEEWGFAGSVFVLFVYLAFVLRGLDTARKAKDDFGRFLAMGISFMFTLYFFVNIGMTTGIMPVVGIPLPFMSYGGSALFANFIAAGMLINIRTRRFELFY